MIQLTIDQLLAIMPNAKNHMRASMFLAPLNAAMYEFGIDTPARAAAFLAQVGHESGELVYVKELASGEAYEGRHDLGNTSPGDGVKYKGRGLLQITGKANYIALAADLKLDCVEHPELMEQPYNAARSAGWFWKKHNLNQYADSGDFITLTKRVNGGTNGLASRQALWEAAKKALAA
jgi:putative chitinase